MTEQAVGVLPLATDRPLMRVAIEHVRDLAQVAAGAQSAGQPWIEFEAARVGLARPSLALRCRAPQNQPMSDAVGELLESRELAALASRIYRLGDAIRAKVRSDTFKLGAVNTALLFFFARTFKTYQAAISLLSNGFWQDAAVLARVLREASYQAAWIAKGGEPTAMLFSSDYERNRRNVIRTLAEVAVPEIKAQAREIAAATAPDEMLDEWWRNWWSKKREHSIGWLARELGYSAGHRLEFPTLSAFVHSSPALLNHYLHDRAKGEMMLETRPGIADEDRSFAETVTWTIFAAFIDACRTFTAGVGFDFEKDFEQLDGEMRKIAEGRE